MCSHTFIDFWLSRNISIKFLCTFLVFLWVSSGDLFIFGKFLLFIHIFVFFVLWFFPIHVVYELKTVSDKNILILGKTVKFYDVLKETLMLEEDQVNYYSTNQTHDPKYRSTSGNNCLPSLILLPSFLPQDMLWDPNNLIWRYLLYGTTALEEL